MEGVTHLKIAKSILIDDLSIDRTHDDVTANLLGLGKDVACNCYVIAKEDGIFAGQAAVEALQDIYRAQLIVTCLAVDGKKILAGEKVVTLKGPTGLCLSVERSLLNFLTHLSGVASLTRKFVDAVQPFPTKIIATRKTLPGLRDLQLAAVVAGGGMVHRRSLSDGILIKDNHIQMASEEALLTNAENMRSPLHRVEIEVQNLIQLNHVLEKSPDVVMLDNMSVEDMKTAIALIRLQSEGRTKIEGSGGVNLNTVRAMAELGVDYISVGMITHSAPILNMSMDFER